jgi:hypothetical protein
MSVTPAAQSPRSSKSWRIASAECNGWNDGASLFVLAGSKGIVLARSLRREEITLIMRKIGEFVVWLPACGFFFVVHAASMNIQLRNAPVPAHID